MAEVRYGSMEPRFEFFDHTADMGMRVYAPTMSALLVPAAHGLYAMIGDLATSETSLGTASDDPTLRDSVAHDGAADGDASHARASGGDSPGDVSHSVATGTVTIDFAGDEPAVMLRDYLDELLVQFDRDKRIVTAFDEAELSEARLHALIRMSAIDKTRSVFHREVKAITYHELDIVPVKGGFQATVIVDI